MDKVLINLHVPSIGMTFDVLIPVFLSIKEVCHLLGGILEDLSAGRYVSSGDELLSSFERNCVLEENSTMEEYEVFNGEHLLFC